MDFSSLPKFGHQFLGISQQTASYHNLFQPGAGDFTELCVRFVIRNRPAEPKRVKGGALERVPDRDGEEEPRSGSGLPVGFTEPRRVQLVQQEMCDDVEGVFVGFVEHVPGNEQK